MERLIVAGFCFVLLGCTSGAQLARERAMREYNCVISEDRVRWLSTSPLGDIYQVDACNHVVTYACDEFKGTCIKESDDRRP